MNSYKKEISGHAAINVYWIFIPVFYENETKPAWRRVYTGSREECEREFSKFPDRLTATQEENRKNRENKRKEMIFLDSIGKRSKADDIRKQYNF